MRYKKTKRKKSTESLKRKQLTKKGAKVGPQDDPTFKSDSTAFQEGRRRKGMTSWSNPKMHGKKFIKATKNRAGETGFFKKMGMDDKQAKAYSSLYKSKSKPATYEQEVERFKKGGKVGGSDLMGYDLQHD